MAGKKFTDGKITTDHAAGIIETYKALIGDPAFFVAVGLLIRFLTDAANSINAAADCLLKCDPLLSECTQTMFVPRGLILEADGDVNALSKILEHRRDQYLELAAIIRESTCAEDKHIHGGVVPDSIFMHATIAFIRVYESITGDPVVYAKGAATGGSPQDSTAFIFECFKLIDPSLTLGRVTTNINNALAAIKENRTMSPL